MRIDWMWLAVFSLSVSNLYAWILIVRLRRSVVVLCTVLEDHFKHLLKQLEQTDAAE